MDSRGGRSRLICGWLPALLVLAAASGCIRTAATAVGVDPGRITRMKVELNVMVPMRDGVNLATDIYRPAAEGRYPAILMRLPYGSEGGIWDQLAKYFVRNGYVFLAQDTRGTFDSEGVWFPFIFEFDDGHDTVAWVTERDWFDGKLGMFGGSYFGYTQLTAAVDNPAVTCMVPIMTSGNVRYVLYRGGAMEFVSAQGWITGMKNAEYERQGLDTRVEPDYGAGFFNEPIRPARPVDYGQLITDPAELAKGPEAWLGHPGDIEGIPPLNYEDNYSKVSAPMLMIAGWYDIFLGPQLDDFSRFVSEGKGDAKKSRIIVGPWSHGGFFEKTGNDPLGGLKVLGRSLVDWYDFWLRGIDNGADREAPVKLFVMGENVWRDEQEWPLARAVYTNYYLSGDGAADQGVLSTEPPTGEKPDLYVYDPNDPVPTSGGDFLGAGPYKPGAQSQSGIAERQDVLVYETAPLDAPLEITGPLTLVLYASSSARDTDWVAKLLDVDEKGEARLLRQGVVRARYRNGYQDPSAIEPGEVYEYRLDLWATSNLFEKGHRIAVWVTSSDFPQYDRNTNAAGEGGPGHVVVAEQAVYHDAQRPSHLILPVIPR